MTKKTQLLRRLFLGVLGLLPCLACFSPSEGDRTTTGTCPAGETCSTTTTGLFFVGTLDIGDGGPRHIGSVAVGGTERVELRAGTTLETATTFATPVDVVSDTPAVLAVEGTATGTVTLRGVSEGTAMLRVLEHGTTTLIDRVVVNVMAVQEVTLRAAGADDGLVTPDAGAVPFALFDGARVELGVSLASLDVIVDTSLAVTDAATGRSLALGTDGAPYRFAYDASAARGASFSVRVAGRSERIDLPVVRALDEVQLDVDRLGTTSGRVCATPRAGGHAVLGAGTPTFSASGATIVAQNGACVSYERAIPGATITATIHGTVATAQP